MYERLRDDILRGQLPPGDKLRIEFVSERYDAGHSPVREALNRLSSDGLVDRRDQRGFYVAAASVADLLELTRTRCWLEEIGLRESMRAFTPEWEEGVVLAHAPARSRMPRSISPDEYQENPEWERLHRAFHRSLIAGCGSRWLLGFCDQLADQAYRYRQLSVQRVYPKRKEKDEHEAIVQCRPRTRRRPGRGLADRALPQDRRHHSRQRRQRARHRRHPRAWRARIDKSPPEHAASLFHHRRQPMNHKLLCTVALLSAGLVHAQDVQSEKTVGMKLAIELVSAAVEECSAKGYNTVAAVVDRSGYLKALVRADNARPHAIDIAIRKAHTSAMVGYETGRWPRTSRKA